MELQKIMPTAAGVAGAAAVAGGLAIAGKVVVSIALASLAASTLGMAVLAGVGISALAGWLIARAVANRMALGQSAAAEAIRPGTEEAFAAPAQGGEESQAVGADHEPAQMERAQMEHGGSSQEATAAQQATASAAELFGNRFPQALTIEASDLTMGTCLYWIQRHVQQRRLTPGPLAAQLLRVGAQSVQRDVLNEERSLDESLHQARLRPRFAPRQVSSYQQVMQELPETPFRATLLRFAGSESSLAIVLEGDRFEVLDPQKGSWMVNRSEIREFLIGYSKLHANDAQPSLIWSLVRA